MTTSENAGEIKPAGECWVLVEEEDRGFEGSCVRRCFSIRRKQGHELTILYVEHHIAKISSAQHAFAVTSGMGALDVIFRLLKPGEEIIAGNDLYGGSNRLLGYLKTHNGIHTHHVEIGRASCRERVS